VIAAEWSALWLSLQVALWCLALILVPGVFLGWLLARKRFPGKPLLEALIYAPLVLPPVVTGYALLALLGRKGPVGHWLDAAFGVQFAFNATAAVLAAAVVSFPLLARAVKLGVELVDPRLETAAATLGASPLRRFFTITLPLAAPGLLAGLTLAFARSLGEFGATIVFAGNIEGETRTLPLAIFTFLQQPGKEAAVLNLALISIVVSLIALLLAEWGARRLRRRLEGRP